MITSIKTLLLATATVLGIAGTASASLVIESWDESNPAKLLAGAIPGGTAKNDVLTALGFKSLDGYYGSQIRLTAKSKVTYTFVGFEAGYANKFLVGSNVFDTEAYAPNNKVIDVNGLASFSQTADAGLLDFRFRTNSNRNGVINGNENTNNFGLGGKNPDFFASIIGAPSAKSGKALWVFLDDLGANDDDNHDDLVVRIDVAPVPLPAGIALMGTALAGLGFVRRRKA